MNAEPRCLYCDKTSQEMPLICLKFQGNDLWICPQHLPILIHEPDKLSDKLPGMKPGQPGVEPPH